MKTLIILRGIDTCSPIRKEWIEKQGIEKYIVSIDSVKKMYGAIEDTEKLGPKITRMDNREISYKFLEMVDNKMRKGCLVVVDAENLKNKDLKKLEAFADVYNYKIFQKIFPISHKDILEWKNRLSNPMNNYPYLPESSEELMNKIQGYFNIFMNSPRSGYPEIEDMKDLEKYFEEEEKNKNYKITIPEDYKITHIGDIHGAYELIEDIKIKSEKEIIVFHGDYIDRGDGSRKVLEKVIKLKRNYPNQVYLIEGNHEMHLRRYCGLKKYTKLSEEGFFKNLCADFTRTTQKEFEMESSDKMISILRDLNTYLQEYLIIKRGPQTFICTHGGLRNVSQLWYYLVGNLTYGNRDIENYDKSFSSKVYKKNYKNIYSIHGHCKYPKYCVHKYPGVVNLDADVDNMVAIFWNHPGMSDDKIDDNISIRRK
jgi:predicted kinase/predicted phosphodiesterase